MNEVYIVVSADPTEVVGVYASIEKAKTEIKAMMIDSGVEENKILISEDGMTYTIKGMNDEGRFDIQAFPIIQ